MQPITDQSTTMRCVTELGGYTAALLRKQRNESVCRSAGLLGRGSGTGAKVLQTRFACGVRSLRASFPGVTLLLKPVLKAGSEHSAYSTPVLVPSSANGTLECDWYPVSFFLVHHHGSKMLRSESNSSITATQPAIGWQPISLPLCSFLFLFPSLTFLL
jgi:hypothetical protein